MPPEIEGIFIPRDILHNKKLTSTAKVIYGVLLARGGEEVSTSYLQELLGISDRILRVNIQDLMRLNSDNVYSNFAEKHADDIEEGPKKTIITIKENKDSNTYIISSTITTGAHAREKLASKPTRSDEKEESFNLFSGEKLKSEKKTPHYVTAVQSLMTLWEKLGLRTPKNKSAKGNTGAAVKLQSIMSGTFKEYPEEHKKYTGIRFSKAEMENIFRNFALAAINDDYHPISREKKAYLRQIPLSDFLYNKFFPPKFTCSFLLYLEKPKLVHEEPDNYPKTTKRLLYLYGRDYLGGAVYNGRLDKFRKASNLLHDYLKKYNDKIYPHFRTIDDVTKADWLFDAVQSSVRGMDFTMTPGFLCSEETFSVRLPHYLNAQAIFMGE